MSQNFSKAVMSQGPEQIYQFGAFRLDAEKRVLHKEGNPLALTPKVLETLLVLVERHGRVVEKEELMQRLWPDSFVEEANLTQNISVLRKVLGESPNQHRYIVTVPGRGYRFVAEVTELGQEETDLLVEERIRSRIVISEEGEAAAPARSGEALVVDESRLLTTGQRRRETDHRLNWRHLLTTRVTLVGMALAALAIAALVYLLLLRRSTPPVLLEIKSLAVLPLENLSGDSAQDYFADGMTDALITELAKIGALRVISRHSVMRYKGARKPLLEIAQELNVDGIVKGAVLRSGERIRITAQLIHPATDRHVWAESYERDLREVLALQRGVVRAIAGEVRVKLSPSEQTHLAKALQVNPEAYLYYLRGKALDARHNQADNQASIDLLERAVTIDPTFSAAYARLAVAHVDRYFYFAPDDQKLSEEKAYTAVETALALDPDSSDAYFARGRLLWTPSNHFPHETAIHELRRAIILNPNSDDARCELALILNHIGLNEKALYEAQTADAINPSAKRPLSQIGHALLWQGKYEAALPVLLSIPKEFNPGSAGSFIAWALFQLGRRDEAIAKLEEYSREYPQDTGGRFAAVQALLLAAGGEERKALQNIRNATKKQDFGHFHHTAHFIASAYARMNKPEEAIHWLREAAENGFPCYPLFERDANLNPLRQDPRFIAFMERQKKQWEYFKATL